MNKKAHNTNAMRSFIEYAKILPRQDYYSTLAGESASNICILGAVTQGGVAFIVVLPVQLLVAAFVVFLPRREEYYEKI